MTLSTRKCSCCGLTVAAPQNPAQIIPDDWTQDARSPYGLVCGKCRGLRMRDGWLPPARYEINYAKKREALERIAKGSE